MEEKYKEYIRELLSGLPDSGEYKWAWDECTLTEQDRVKEIREKFEKLIN